MPLFKSSKVIETQIDEFLDTVAEGGLVFQQGVAAYVGGHQTDFDARLRAIDGLESRADKLSREVEAHLYTHSLIPEHRGDVLGLLENTDSILDDAKACLNQFSVEQIRRKLGCDSLGYLSIEGMLSTSSHPDSQFCVACFSGKYPTRIEAQNGKTKLG